MIIGRVVATVVSTEKHTDYLGHKLLMVQPLDAYGEAKGKTVLAVDGVQAGIGDKVLLVDEGGSARSVVGDESALRIRTAICGIIDSVDIEEQV